MQLTPDRNGGVSTADFAQLYLPAQMDPVYGYQAVNVEAQRDSATSLLNWTRTMLAVRRRHEAFAVLNAGGAGGGEVARAFVARAWPNGNDRFLSAPLVSDSSVVWPVNHIF
jgi:maltose alpha-D-glucosyltransferase/alpha-amylase